MAQSDEFLMQDQTPGAKGEETPAPHSVPLPEVSFSTFVLSLNASALVHLGILEDPATGQRQKNLVMGKQTIDILALLEEKTRGNLTGEEEGLLQNLLYDLRMVYVRERR